MQESKALNELFKLYETHNTGLTTEEASLRLKKYGLNTLEKEAGFNIFKIIIHQFTDPLIYILIIAAIITALLKDYIDTAVIIAVITINAIIGFIQEFKAEKSISALISLTAPKALVVRNDRVEEIDSKELVPGDIVLLTSGTKVPADLKLIEANRLEADESALTGESLPVRKEVKFLKEEGKTGLDNIDSAFMGTLILSGRGKGIVTETGKNTKLGQISYEVARLKSAETPLQIKLNKMSRTIGLGIVGICTIAVIIGLMIGESFYDMVLTGIALTVGAIPEGLPIVVTITLAIGVKRMAERNAIVRRLPAVETLGSTTVIASDKTGTMTKNEMTVVKIFAGGSIYKVTGSGFAPKGEIIPEKEEANKNIALEITLRAGLLANESTLEFDDEKGQYRPKGDPTEVCLITSAMKGGLHEGKELVDYEMLDEIPFESERLFMATLYHHRNESQNIAFVKGAPDKILKMCDKQLDNEGNIGEIDKTRILLENKAMGLDGLRVLAMAYKPFPKTITHIEPDMFEKELVFLGLQGMFDAPREEVYIAIQQAKRSGIKVIMVTGDHMLTALSIAKRLEIVEEDNAKALTGDDLDRMSDDELYEQIGIVSVFSRVSPLHKLRIVQQLIKRGDIVAVTGDGVNDTPALKAAHIGVAMGLSGTDAAKETAEMVITDDNFASIFAAVKEGRVVFSNIRKVILFLLSSGLSQVILIILTLIMRLPLPLLPGQIIWMNLVTNGLQDVAMAFEPAEKGVEYQKPRPKDEPIISRLIIERLILVGVVLAIGSLAVYLWQLSSGASLDKCRTMTLTTLVMYQLFNVFNMRSETRSVFRMNPLSNPFLFFSIIGSIIAQIAVIYWAPLQFLFRTTPLEPYDWMVIISISLTIIAVVELDKLIRKIIKPKKS